MHPAILAHLVKGHTLQKEVFITVIGLTLLGLFLMVLGFLVQRKLNSDSAILMELITLVRDFVERYEAREKSRVNGHLCVLVVDDDPSIEKICGRILQNVGYCVKAAYNGKMAMEFLGRFTPKVILLDLDMPTVSGWQFRTMQLDSEWRDIPVVLMTAAMPDKKIVESFEAAATLPKPFVPLSLLEILNKLRIFPQECLANAHTLEPVVINQKPREK